MRAHGGHDDRLSAGRPDSPYHAAQDSADAVDAPAAGSDGHARAGAERAEQVTCLSLGLRLSFVKPGAQQTLADRNKRRARNDRICHVYLLMMAADDRL
jgi:hypothetical protein